MQDYPTKTDGVSTEPAAEYNNLATELKNSVTTSGISLSSGDSNQLGKTMANYGAASDFYTDTGTANTYVLSPSTTMKSATEYFDGMRVRFIASNTNTGTSTVNVNALGVKTIYKLNPAVVLDGGDMEDGSIITVEYDASLDASAGAFILTNNGIEGAVSVEVDYPPHYIYGIAASETTGDYITHFDIGYCLDSTLTKNINVISAWTKNISSNWVSGTGNGGKPSSVTITNGTWYHKFAIMKTDGTIDFGIDTSLTAANLLADATLFTYYRLVDSLYFVDTTDYILKYGFEQIGSRRIRKYLHREKFYTQASLAAGHHDITLLSPIGYKTLVKINNYFQAPTGGANTGFFYEEGSTVPTLVSNTSVYDFGGWVAGSYTYPLFSTFVRTSETSKITMYIHTTSSSWSMDMCLLSWED